MRTEAQVCFDRVVFAMKPSSGAGGQPGYGVRYENGPFTEDPSDMPLPVKGNAFIVVRFEPVQSVDQTKPDFPRTYTGPSTLEPSGLAHVVQIRNGGDFEGVMIWIIGLDSKRPFTVDLSSQEAVVLLEIEIG